MIRRWAWLGVLALAAAGCANAEPVEAGPSPTGSPDATSPEQTVAAELAAFYDQQPDWQSCRDGFECATVTVPLDYADPTGETIALALLKVPATDPARRIGSLFVNPGGPGASGLDYAAAADAIVSPAVRAVYDVVGFDPRGVGESTPVECISDADLDRSFVEGDSTPDTPAEIEGLLASTEEFRAGCTTKSGELLPHVGTADVARDLDVLRAVVGDDTLTYLGKSYGTSIGVEYVRQFPATADRLVLDGAVDPELSDRDVLLGQAGGFELALSRFVDDCLAQGCSLGSSTRQVLDAVAGIIDEADDTPLPTSSRPLSQTLAVYGIIGPLYWPASQGYPLLEQALEQALGGDGTALLELADLYLQRSPDGTFPTNQWDVYTPVSCLDRPGEWTPADVQALLPEFTDVSPRFGESLAWGLTACTDWPIPSDGLPAPVPAPGAPPVLVVGTTGDPATPYEWAVSLAAQLESGVLLTYDGTPHTAYRKGNACVDSAVDGFFIEGTVPEEGLRCS
jgi:pimeloyl-ACP methyl ester carboxylesterase